MHLHISPRLWQTHGRKNRPIFCTLWRGVRLFSKCFPQSRTKVQIWITTWLACGNFLRWLRCILRRAGTAMVLHICLVSYIETWNSHNICAPNIARKHMLQCCTHITTSFWTDRKKPGENVDCVETSKWLSILCARNTYVARLSGNVTFLLLQDNTGKKIQGVCNPWLFPRGRVYCSNVCRPWGGNHRNVCSCLTYRKYSYHLEKPSSMVRACISTSRDAGSTVVGTLYRSVHALLQQF